jgi:hypothetical protein
VMIRKGKSRSENISFVLLCGFEISKEFCLAQWLVINFRGARGQGG